MRGGLAVALVLIATPAAAGGWKPIFNGRDLGGWTPKINHHPAGENWNNTFRVENGVLKVSYADYRDGFRDEFAHLVYDRPLSHYRLRLEYRFVGPLTRGSPAWAIRNSGVMLHGQAAKDMALNQPFPISVEAQLLGAAPGETRHTGNVCTPGVSAKMDGKPILEHCRDSATQAAQDGEWVRFEVEVRGGEVVRHYVNGVKVMEYGELALDPREYRRFANIDPGDAKPAPLTEGYISLQGESSPVEFRKIEVKRLRE